MVRYAWFVIAAAGLEMGCYNYLPRPAELEPAMYLAVTLTDSGSDALGQYVGPGVKVVRGHFVRAMDQGPAISVASVETRRGMVLEWRGETVVVPREYIHSIEERQLGRAKTILFAGVSLAGFFAAYAAFGPGASGASGSGSGGPPIFH
jgi:hypothetical protein